MKARRPQGIDTLDAAAARRLGAFLVAPERAPETLDLSELKGFLFALACAPQAAPPSAWLPRVFGGDMPEWRSLDEARAVLDALMALYNQVNAEVVSGKPRLPASCMPRPITLDNFGPDAPLGRWAGGFAVGFAGSRDAWDAAELDDEARMETVRCVADLSFFSDRTLAEKLCRLQADDEADDDDAFFGHAVDRLGRINRSMRRLARIGRAAYLRALHAPQASPRAPRRGH
jgi:uncharacterized protein